MSVITIPKVLRDKLGEDGADAIVKVINEADKDGKKDLRSELNLELSDIRSDVKLIKWMLGILLAGVVSLVMKTFFTS
jgi:hypothetical protein